MNISLRRGTKLYRPIVGLNRWIQGSVVTLCCMIIFGYYHILFTGSIDKGFTKNDTMQKDSSRFYGETDRYESKYKPKATIGYAITVSGCPKKNGSRGDFGAGITDGAAVLKHSIHLNSIRNAQNFSKYDYQMYALVHPQAELCARTTFEPLGYQIMIRDVPVPLDQIEGEYLREKVPENGCCGEKEFVKLHAYTLTNHPIVVHLDLDTLVLKPLDNLFDVMIDGLPNDGSNGGVQVAFDDRLITTDSGAARNSPVNAFFTRDYNMAHASMKHAGVQGGFLVLRPSLQVFDEFVSIIRKGDFRPNGGWGGAGFGPFYGSMTFQGIIPYFYDHLHPGTAVELNRCVYNNMADNPRDQPTRNDIVAGHCRDGYNRPDKGDECEDCRSRTIDEVVTTHFTLCQKPWECLPQDENRIQERLCRKFHAEWFRVRENLETKVWGRKEVDVKNDAEILKERGGKYQTDHFRGYCTASGKNGYIQIDVPNVARH